MFTFTLSPFGNSDRWFLRPDGSKRHSRAACEFINSQALWIRNLKGTRLITRQRIVTTLILVEAEPLRNFAKTKGMCKGIDSLAELKDLLQASQLGEDEAKALAQWRQRQAWRRSTEQRSALESCDINHLAPESYFKGLITGLHDKKVEKTQLLPCYIRL